MFQSKRLFIQSSPVIARVKTVAKVAMLAFGALTLVACHNGYKPLSGSAAGAGGEGSAAQTYGVNGQSGYEGQTKYDSSGRVINPLVAPANQTYYFDFDSNEIQASDMNAIHIQANYLATHPKAKVRLEGNTDNRGSREYNVGLGWRRDQALARIFEQQGVLPKQIDMVSYGKEHPAVDGNNEHAWSLNRRVNLVYEAY